MTLRASFHETGERGRLLSPLLSTLERLSPRAVVRDALAGRTSDSPPTALVSLGKAAVAMAEGALDAGLNPARLLVIAPGETDRGRGSTPASIRLLPGDHPVPGRASFAAGRSLFDFVRTLGPEDRLLALLSGGGSALAEHPAPGLTEEDLSAFNREALRVALPIAKINAVRKRLSAIKGGRLAAACRAPVEAFIVSDVPPGRPELVASGPFHPDAGTDEAALAILAEAGLAERLPRIAAHLGGAPPFPAGGSVRRAGCPAPLPPLTTTVLLDRRMFARALSEAYRAAGFPRVTVADDDYDLTVEALADRLVDRRDAASPGELLLFAGEATVTLRGGGCGGRCQELAARMLARLRTGDTLLAFATDGVDGRCPSPVAGAFADGDAAAALSAAGLDAGSYLSRSDSHALLDRLGALVETGPTGHNVGDVVVWRSGYEK